MELARDKSPNEQAEQYLRAQRWSGVEPLNLAPAQVAAADGPLVLDARTPADFDAVLGAVGLGSGWRIKEAIGDRIARANQTFAPLGAVGVSMADSSGVRLGILPRSGVADFRSAVHRVHSVSASPRGDREAVVLSYEGGKLGHSAAPSMAFVDGTGKVVGEPGFFLDGGKVTADEHGFGRQNVLDGKALAAALIAEALGQDGTLRLPAGTVSVNLDSLDAALETARRELDRTRFKSPDDFDRRKDALRADGEKKRWMDDTTRNRNFAAADAMLGAAYANLHAAKSSIRRIRSGGPKAHRVSFGPISVQASSFLGALARTFGMSSNLDEAYEEQNTADVDIGYAYSIRR